MLIFLFAANVVFTLLTALFPGWLPHQFFGIDFLVENRKRVLGAAAQYRDGVVSANDPLVVILGLSSASEGIEIEQLAAAHTKTRFLGLVGAGRNMRDVQRYARPLLDSDLSPQLVVFAINPFHLLDPPSPREGFVANLRREPAVTEVRGQWFYKRRGDIQYAFGASVFDARTTIFRAFNVRTDDADPNPWREIVRMNLPQTASEQQWQTNLRRYGERGYYETAAYARSAEQIDALAGLINKFSEHPTDILIVLMPEHSKLRARIPSFALDTLLQPLTQALGGTTPKIVDMRATVPDSGFTDISHMNSVGRRLFTPLLSGVIATHQSEAEQSTN